MRTPITYYGGKQRLAERILQMMPGHRIYCEPFFVGGNRTFNFGICYGIKDEVFEFLSYG